MNVGRIEINWSEVQNVEAFFQDAFSQMKAPNWHGRNLDALADSWVTGGTCDTGPPYDFSFVNLSLLNGGISEFARSVLQIAEESVARNGGSVSV